MQLMKKVNDKKRNDFEGRNKEGTAISTKLL